MASYDADTPAGLSENGHSGTQVEYGAPGKGEPFSDKPVCVNHTCRYVLPVFAEKIAELTADLVNYAKANRTLADNALVMLEALELIARDGRHNDDRARARLAVEAVTG